jgi:hypothetical protein
MPVTTALVTLSLAAACWLGTMSPTLRSTAVLLSLDWRWVPHRAFDAAAWRDAAPQTDVPRGSMLRDLVRRHGLLGMDAIAVEGLLGTPDGTLNRSGAIGWAPYVSVMRYDLGACSGWRVDMDELWLYMDERNTVVGWAIRQT